MVTSPIALLIQPALERGTIEQQEITSIQRQWQESRQLDKTDADALFALQGRLAGRDKAFNPVFEEMIAFYVLDQGEMTGNISNEQGHWILSMLDGGEGLVANSAELELLVKLIERADGVPEALATFALHQIQHSAMTGEGPAAKGRIHFSRIIDKQDTATIARLLQVAKGNDRRIISRAEAEILFDMAEACTGANDPAWDGLFAEAIQSHLIATNRPGKAVNRTNGLSLTTPVVLDERDSAWLQARIQHDGQVSRAERALLALIKPRQMASANRWDNSIGQML